MERNNRRSTIKTVSVTNIDEIREHAMRLVSEGAVELEEDANASYERQGNMAFYSEENLAQRIAIRNHPLLKRLTCAFWRLVCQGHHLMHYEGYSTVMIRVHKILMEHFNTTKSYDRIRHDWESDAKGGDILYYDEFHLSMFELVDLWCDSIHVEDYISLLYLILEGITRIVDARFVLQPLDEILYTDVVDSALQKSMSDIENIMASIAEDPLEELPKETVPVHSAVKSIPPQPPPTEESSIRETRMQSGDKTQSTVSRPAVQRAQPHSKSLDEAGAKESMPVGQVTPVDKSIENELKNPTSQLRLDSPPQIFDDGLTSAITPWEDIVQATVPIETQQPSNNTLLPPISAYHEQTTEQAKSLSDEVKTTASSTQVLPVIRASNQQQNTVVVPQRPQKESLPLEHRNFGGFSIISSRDGVPVHANNVRVSDPYAPNGRIKFGSAQMFQNKAADEARIAEIRHAFRKKSKQSFVRKLTPPNLIIMESKPINEEERPSLFMEFKGKRLAKKSSIFHKESVGLVAALASSTLGSIEEDYLGETKPSSLLPLSRVLVESLNSFKPKSPPKSPFQHGQHSDSNDAEPLVNVGLNLLQRPTGAPKNMLPRRIRRDSLAKKIAESNGDDSPNNTQVDLFIKEQMSSPRRLLVLENNGQHLPKHIIEVENDLSVSVLVTHEELARAGGNVVQLPNSSSLLESHSAITGQGFINEKHSHSKYIKPLTPPPIKDTISSPFNRTRGGDINRQEESKLVKVAPAIGSASMKSVAQTSNLEVLVPRSYKSPVKQKAKRCEELKFNTVLPTQPPSAELVKAQRVPK